MEWEWKWVFISIDDLQEKFLVFTWFAGDFLLFSLDLQEKLLVFTWFAGEGCGIYCGSSTWLGCKTKQTPSFEIYSKGGGPQNICIAKIYNSQNLKKWWKTTKEWQEFISRLEEACLWLGGVWEGRRREVFPRFAAFFLFNFYYAGQDKTRSWWLLWEGSSCFSKASS